MYAMAGYARFNLVNIVAGPSPAICAGSTPFLPARLDSSSRLYAFGKARCHAWRESSDTTVNVFTGRFRRHARLSPFILAGVWGDGRAAILNMISLSLPSPASEVEHRTCQPCMRSLHESRYRRDLKVFMCNRTSTHLGDLGLLARSRIHATSPQHTYIG